MIIVILPAVFYLALHLLGIRYPALLWGVDQLHYYPLSVSLFFFATTITALLVAIRTPWAARLDQGVTHSFGRLSQLPFARFTAKILVIAIFLLAAYLLRDRDHLLGDSDMWLKMVARSAQPAWGLLALPDIASFPDFAQRAFYFQPLDVLLHVQAYHLGNRLFGWSPADSYEWFSCIAGVFYLLTVWAITAFLASDFLARLTLWGLALTLGTLQLYFGYAESYTLVNLAVALYILQVLRHLRGGALLWPGLCLLLAAVLHLQALSLLPSYLYLVWRKSAGRIPASWRRPAIYLPAFLVLGLLGIWAYHSFYPYRLPFFVPDEAGKFAVFSSSHLAVLANELLLLSPFGIVWGVIASCRRSASPHSPASCFLGWAALGSGLLILLHDAYYAGRDWDLLSLPALFYTLWGGSLLAAHELRLVRWGLMPLMVLHTGLWIGINATERAVDRLGNLLQHGNQAQHYRLFTQGHYYQDILHEPEQAIPFYRAAIEQVPPGQTDGTRERYRKRLGYCLVLTGQDQEGVEVFAKAYSHQTKQVLSAPDLSNQYSWASALARLAAAASHGQKDDPKAQSLWEEVLVRCQVVLALEMNARFFHLRASALQALGRYDAAEDTCEQNLRMARDPGTVYDAGVRLAQVLQRTGRLNTPDSDLERLYTEKQRGPEQLRQLADLYYTTGHYELAAVIYPTALHLDAQNADAHANLGVSLIRLAQPGEAEQEFREAIRLRPDQLRFYPLLGAAEVLLGKTSDGAAAMQQAVDLGLRNRKVYMTLGELYQQIGQPDQALRVYRQFLDSPPPDATHAHYHQLSVKLEELGDRETASVARRVAEGGTAPERPRSMGQ